MLKYLFLAFSEPDNLKEYCTTLLLNQLPDGSPGVNEKYYLLSDDLKEDYVKRKELHMKRLDMVLAQHQFERSDRTFERSCLYCRDVLKPSRSTLIEHLFNKHFLQLGKSEHLVFIEELVDDVKQKLDLLICLFCEKTFKDRATLKEHMRKKGHKRINPENKNYDIYFIINYKNEFKGRTSKAAAKSKASDLVRAAIIQSSNLFQSESSDSDWSDWDGEKPLAKCLFCSRDSSDFKEFNDHLVSEHEVDFEQAIAALTFYERVKVVNYIRRQMYIFRCVTCNEECQNMVELQEHLKVKQHFGIGAKECWNKPEFFFPTYEDDAVLCYLDNSSCNKDETEDEDCTSLKNEEGVIVICEETKASVNPDAEALSKENYLF